MSFAEDQIRQLQKPPAARALKAREVEGRTLPYLEGWRAISEANRIFGHANWDRETVASECVVARNVDGMFVAAYVVRARITVRAGEARIVREGCGSGEAFAPTAGQAHERAAKAAETDATKRALSTFGPSFGLSLYAGLGKAPRRGAPEIVDDEARRESAGDCTRAENRLPEARSTDVLDPATGLPGRVDKAALALAEPRRRRDPDHLRFVAASPCLVCARQPSQAHHLRFAQPRAMGRKVSDEFVVPLCPSCHQQLHLAGDERRWWKERRIEPLAVAESYWSASRRGEAEVDAPERRRPVEGGAPNEADARPRDRLGGSRGL